MIHPGEGNAQEDLSWPWERSKEDRQCTVVPPEIPRSSAKLKYRKFHLNTKYKFFIVKVILYRTYCMERLHSVHP